MYVAFVFCRHNSSKHSSFKIDVLANTFIIAVRYRFTFFVLFQLFVIRKSRKTKKSQQILRFSITIISGAADKQSGDFKCAHQALNLVLKVCAVWFIWIIMKITFLLGIFAFICVCTLQIFVSKKFCVRLHWDNNLS